MPRRYYSSTAVATTLSSNASNSATSITVAALSGYPAQTPWTGILSPDTASEEVVTVTNVSGTTLTVTRGVDGTTASSHNAGAVFRHGVSARDFDEANAFINASGEVAFQASAPSSPNDGDVWIDSDSSVNTLNPNDYVGKSLFANKGTIAAASAASTPAALSVGNNGEALIADSTTTTGLRWQPAYNAGRNRIINGDFSCWQRGTSFSNPANAAYTADRWSIAYNGTGATRTISRQAFTPGAAPVAGYEGSFFFRYALTVAGTSNTVNDIRQPIEDVRTFAGQTVTLSFWAKCDAARSITATLSQDFGSGGSSATFTSTPSISVGTSWERYTATLSVPSVSGKTIGTNSFLLLYFSLGNSPATFTFDLWGVQVEAGSVATRFEEEPFEATLRKCQRYYYLHAEGSAEPIGMGTNANSTTLYTTVQFPTTMRTDPAVEATSGTNYYDFSRNNASDNFNSLSLITAVVSINGAGLQNTSEISGTAGHAGIVYCNNAAAKVAFSAEL